MDRKKELLRFVSKDALGVEIAPYFNPLTPKSEGYNCRIIDVLGEDDLRAGASKDPQIPNERLTEIEPVDFVGDGSFLDELMQNSPELGQCDYVISSHNFEHLPNPIRFLRGCERVLRPGGVLSMAIPDYRACFDHFRFPTRLADWIDAFHEDRTKPSGASVLDFRLNMATYCAKDGTERPGFKLGKAKFKQFKFHQNLPAIHQEYLEKPEAYIDTHCSVTCPEIFHLLINDLIHIGLINFEVVSISKTQKFEYFVHLRKPENPSTADQSSYQTYRPHLLNAATRAIGYPSRRNVLARLLEKWEDSHALNALAGQSPSRRYVVNRA